MLKEAALFLLTVPPIDEITDKIQHIVEKHRANIITKPKAIEILVSQHETLLNSFIQTNKDLDLVLGRK